MKIKTKLSIIVSTIGFLIALTFMVAANVHRVNSVRGEDLYMKGHVIDIKDNILVIEVDSFDFPIEDYQPVELRLINLGHEQPDPVVTPTAIPNSD